MSFPRSLGDGEQVIIHDKINQDYALVALAVGKGESDKKSNEVWTDWTRKGADRAKVYDVDFLIEPMKVSKEIYGKISQTDISLNCNKCSKGKCKCKGTCKCDPKNICKCKGTTLTWREGVRQHLLNNGTRPPVRVILPPRTHSPLDSYPDAPSDDDSPSPTKRRKLETKAERLQRREAAEDHRAEELEKELNKLGFRVDPAAVKTVVQNESIVRDKICASDDDLDEFALYRGSKVCHYVDNVNLSTGWFDEFKLLSSHNALTARGQVNTYGPKLQKLEEFNGKRPKSRIVFFTRQHRDDAKMRSEFEGIVEDYTDIPFSYGLDEVVLVHMSDVNVYEHDASLKVIARSPCKPQGDIAWTEEEVGV